MGVLSLAESIMWYFKVFGISSTSINLLSLPMFNYLREEALFSSMPAGLATGAITGTHRCMFQPRPATPRRWRPFCTCIHICWTWPTGRRSAAAAILAQVTLHRCRSAHAKQAITGFQHLLETSKQSLRFSAYLRVMLTREDTVAFQLTLFNLLPPECDWREIASFHKSGIWKKTWYFTVVSDNTSNLSRNHWLLLHRLFCSAINAPYSNFIPLTCNNKHICITVVKWCT